MVLSVNAGDARMLLEIPFSTNYVIVDQLALNLVDICPDNTPQISCKSLLCFAKIGNIDYSKIPKIWLVKFCMFNFKIAYLAEFSQDFNTLDLKI